MQWRLNRTVHGSWIIEYKEGTFSRWKCVTSNRFQWEPDCPASFKTKSEASIQMAKLIAKYS